MPWGTKCQLLAMTEVNWLNAKPTVRVVESYLFYVCHWDIYFCLDHFLAKCLENIPSVGSNKSFFNSVIDKTFFAKTRP